MNYSSGDVNRVGCEIPGCRRTIGSDRYRRLFGHAPGTWICSVHWKLVPRSLKRIKARHERERRKYGFRLREAAYARVWAAIWRSLIPFEG